MLTGAFVGSETTHYPRADAMERWIDRPFDVQNIFVTWDRSRDSLESVFDRRLPAVWAAGRTPIVTWEPFVAAREETPTTVDCDIADGEHDAYLESWARRLRAWLRGPDGEFGTADDRTLFLRLAHEANGDWYPWSPTRETDPEDYVRMWARVQEIVADGVPDECIEWMWAVNHVDVGDVAAEDIYPGASRVDWVGIDGFNWGATQEWSEWTDPKGVFDEMFGRVRSLGDHPVGVPEYATTSVTTEGPSVAAKNRWIREALAYFAETDVEMAVWFNIDKETDWAVFDAERGDSIVTIGGRRYTAYSAYQRAIQSL